MVQFNRAPGSIYPPASSQVGTANRLNFISQIHGIVGYTATNNIRMLWIANPADTTSSTTVATAADTDGKDLTWDATVASRFTAQGFGVVQTFDGTDDNGVFDADHADLSFNDGGGVGMSIVALANVTNTAAVRTIVSKWDLTTSSEAREWSLHVNGSDILVLEAYDESANVSITRSSDAAISMGALHLFTATYDGTGGENGMASTNAVLYEDGVAIASTAGTNASYVAMEDLGTLPRIGAVEGTDGNAGNFMAGTLGFILITVTELNADQIWAIKEAVNAYYGLTL